VGLGRVVLVVEPGCIPLSTIPCLRAVGLEADREASNMTRARRRGVGLIPWGPGWAGDLLAVEDIRGGRGWEGDRLIIRLEGLGMGILFEMRWEKAAF
jgi:hypothetical protein